MTDLAALLFGAAIIVFFSYERFNRTTDEVGQQLQRLVNLLSPDKLRSRRVVLNAYIFYAFTFLLIYLFLCAYAELIPTLGGPDLTVGASKIPVAPSAESTTATTGYTLAASGQNTVDALWQQPLSATVEPASGHGRFNIGIDASISLAVALMIIGLAPAFPILERFEAWMRGAAHRLAGIPTRVISIRDELRTEVLELPPGPDGEVPQDTLLIPRGDWQRMAHYQLTARGEVDAPEDFRNDLALIFATSAWIFNRKLKLANPQERERFTKLEEELARRKDVLISALDDKTDYPHGRRLGRGEGDNGQTRPDANEEQGDSKFLGWEHLSREADNLADDICMLLALYAEHEIIVTDQPGTEPAPVQSAVALQRNLASRKLEGFLTNHLGDYAGPARSRSFAMVTGLWSLGIVLAFTIAWSVFPGNFEAHLQNGKPVDPYWRVMTYTFSAFMAYCIPITAALALRDGGRQLHRWRNMRVAYWTVFLPQAALVVLVSWGLATIFLLGVALWQAGVTYGWDSNALDPWKTLRYSFAYNGPTPIRGAVLALIIIILLDAWRVPSRVLQWHPTHYTSLAWAGVTSLIMLLVGGGTRLLSTIAGTVAADVPAKGLDDTGRGLILYAGLYSAILGFLVIFSVSEVLLNQRRRPGLVRMKPSGV